MRRTAALLTSATLLVGFAAPVAAASKPYIGGPCKLVHQVDWIKGVRAQCTWVPANTKKNGKLIWKPLAPAKTTATKNELSPTAPPASLAGFAGITSSESLTATTLCKTSDVSGRTDVSMGFPRPAAAMVGKSEPRILVLPVMFPDLPYTDTDLTQLTSTLKMTQEFYTRTSFGSVGLNFIVASREQWVLLPRTADDYGIVHNKPQQNNQVVVEDAIRLADAGIDFSKFDSVLIETGRGNFSGGGQGFPGMTFPGQTGAATRVSFDFGQNAGQFKTLAHELGHSLFGLEDLYVFLNSSRPVVPDPTPAGSWDMMSNSSEEFFGWTKWLNGWLTDSQVRCLTSEKESVHYLTSIAVPGSSAKLVVANLADGVSLAVEVRKFSEGDTREFGVLAYVVDTRIGHGDGPIRARKFLLASGYNADLEGFRVTAGPADADGMLVTVARLNG